MNFFKKLKLARQKMKLEIKRKRLQAEVEMSAKIAMEHKAALDKQIKVVKLLTQFPTRIKKLEKELAEKKNLKNF